LTRSHSQKVSLTGSRTTASVVAIATALIVSAACTTKEPQQSTFFDRTVSPILVTSCVRTNTGVGCHVSSEKGNAFGNLDVSTYAGVARRRDLLLDYGPYGQPAFLVKNVPNFAVEVQTYDGQKVGITTDIKHTGGPILDPTATAYQTLRRWIENGATENNSGAPPAASARTPCSSNVPAVAGFDPTKDPQTPDWGTFQGNVSTVLRKSCAAGNCHGSAANQLYLTCGDTPEQTRWNYFSAQDYLAQSAEQSELLRRPLAPSQGGSFHEGGVVFNAQSDDGYQTLSGWAKEHGPPKVDATDAGFDFFAHKVQPILVKKGCMMLQCHSAAMFHDYRLRGGSGGSFSLSATRRNYQLSLQQMALESDDPTASRLVRKNLYRPELQTNGQGIAHRGGPLFEDFGKDPASPAACDTLNATAPFDFEKGLDKVPSYCVVREWLVRERAVRKLAPLSAIVYVSRPPGAVPDRAQDFDTYAPGADLRRSDAALSPTGDVTVTNDTSLTAGCGLTVATADIRRPSVSWDGKLVAFAARTSSAAPFKVYEMNADGTGCKAHPAVNAGSDAPQNGLLVHNFDPAYSPPDDTGAVHLVFASTRGNWDTAAQAPRAAGDVYDYAGPQRTPSDPTKANANLYVFEPVPGQAGASRIRQLTFLLNTERMPAFMSDGRVIMSAEKRSPGFYQLALRRVNVDGGDYHPLYAQRASIGYHEAMYVVELADKNFAAIFRDQNAPKGGGTIGVFNRSIGIDFGSTDAADYLIDPGVIDPASPMSPEPQFFLHSLKFPDGSASGHLKQPTSGVYTSPAPLPGAKMLVSYGAASDLGGFGGDYDLYVMDPVTGAKTKLLGVAGAAEVEAVAVYARAPKGLFRSTLEEPNGHTHVDEGKSEADVYVLDSAALASLLFQNTPTGRTVEKLSSFELYEDLPPDNGVTSFESGGPNVVSDAFGKVYVRRRLIGNVPVATDSSTHFKLPGGLPFLFHLPDTDDSRAKNIPRYQKETFVFYPGEVTHQSFRREFFNSLCGNCHGSVSGRPVDIAVRPDMLTQASDTVSRDAVPFDLNLAPNRRGAVTGPPPTP
jgi:hypothetical protein